MKLPSKKISIKTIDELQKKRFKLFDYVIYIPRDEFNKMPEELNKSLIIQMNYFEFEIEKEV